MGEILAGTASWTDATLIKCGRFYPRGCSSAEAGLRHYANVFPLVEVDSSYYALPSIRNADLWTERLPDDFVFNVKAFRTPPSGAAAGHPSPPNLKRGWSAGLRQHVASGNRRRTMAALFWGSAAAPRLGQAQIVHRYNDGTCLYSDEKGKS